jgi:hypothetical protein
MRATAKFLVWIGLSVLALGGWPQLALSCDGDMQPAASQGETSPPTDTAHEHHASAGAGTAGAAVPDAQCCGDCAAPCASTGGTVLVPRVNTGSPDFERGVTVAIRSDALPPNPPPTVPFRPPIPLA